MGHFSRQPHDSSRHLLLEPPSPAYSSVTIKRALIVWLQCGQQNEFRDVCNYFHRLECMEDKLSAENRARSRAHEFNLLSNHPPISHYVIGHFPKLYRRNQNNEINVKAIQEVTLENCVFNLEGFHDMRIQKSAKIKDIIITSHIIRIYSKTHSKSLRILFAEFQDFAKKTKIANSVENIAMYIQKLFLKDELINWIIMPKTFSFLDEGEDTDRVDISETNTEDSRDGTIETLINESRRKELNVIPENYQNGQQNVKQNGQQNVAAKLTKLHKKRPSTFYADFAHEM